MSIVATAPAVTEDTPKHNEPPALGGYRRGDELHANLNPHRVTDHSSSSLAFAPVRWGILGAANIALKKVIPAMRESRSSIPFAIASRDLAKATAAAAELGIPRAYGSYEELLADPDVEAIYNPLPNHMHVPWSIRAARAGKHVLSEKPIALSAAEARSLIDVRNETGVEIAEAFMVRTHPQWLQVKELIDEGGIGPLRLVSGHFSYYRRDPNDIRSHRDWGGGALMDIGCYPIFIARWMFGAEPTDVVAMMDRDPDMGIDYLTSALLRFPAGQATFACAGQLVPYQRMQMFGDRGRIEVEIPFNAPPDKPCRVFVDDGSQLGGASASEYSFRAVDQYALQADAFSAAVRGVGSVPVSLETAAGNMAVIDALFRSGEERAWQTVG